MKLSLVNEILYNTRNILLFHFIYLQNFYYHICFVNNHESLEFENIKIRILRCSVYLNLKAKFGAAAENIYTNYCNTIKIEPRHSHNPTTTSVLHTIHCLDFHNGTDVNIE